MFTDAAVKEIARITLLRGTGARGLRAVIEGSLGGGDFRRRGGDSVRDHRPHRQGRRAAQAEHVADEGTAELALVEAVGEPEGSVDSQRRDEPSSGGDEMPVLKTEGGSVGQSFVTYI